MIRMVIGKGCVSCGNCEAWLPGLKECIPHGGVLISENNPNVDAEAIQRAIECCPLDALSLEETTALNYAGEMGGINGRV